MIFNTHALKGVLSQYIESIFHFKDFVPDHSIERVVPTGHIFLIFELDGYTRNTYDNESLVPNASYSKVWISGMHKHYISISAHQKSEMFVVQFKAFGAYPFFHFPIQNLNEKVVAAEGILGGNILELREELLKAESSAKKFQIAESWLLNKYASENSPPSELVSIIEKLQQEPILNYNSIVEDYSKTQKHLIDQFKKYIGLTPKYYQRILRFNELLKQINQAKKIEWAQISYACGYADQSHFIKEFKHFSGFNPQKFIQQGFQKEEPNFFPLDRENQ